MRKLIVCGLLVALAAPLPAMAQDVLEQGNAAVTAFALGVTQFSPDSPRYFNLLTDGIEGTWTSVAPLLEKPDQFDTALQVSCDTQPLTVSLEQPFTISLRHGKSDHTFAYGYAYVGGASFSTSVNTKELLDYLLLNTDNLRGSAQTAIANFTADVTIFRASRDIVVIVHERGPTDILARCPGSPVAAESPAATDPIANALGVMFDKEFGATKPVAREAFVSCVLAGMAPMSEADKNLVLKLNFDPPQKERDRLSATYPGIDAALQVCGAAAQAAAQ